MTRSKIRNDFSFKTRVCLSHPLNYDEGDFRIQFHRKHYLKSHFMKVLASLLSLSLVLTLSLASRAPARVGGDLSDDILCTVCITIVTDIDSWLTSDTTEDQIVEWMYGLCEVT